MYALTYFALLVTVGALTIEDIIPRNGLETGLCYHWYETLKDNKDFNIVNQTFESFFVKINRTSLKSTVDTLSAGTKKLDTYFAEQIHDNVRYLIGKYNKIVLKYLKKNLVTTISLKIKKTDITVHTIRFKTAQSFSFLAYLHESRINVKILHENLLLYQTIEQMNRNEITNRITYLDDALENDTLSTGNQYNIEQMDYSKHTDVKNALLIIEQQLLNYSKIFSTKFNSWSELIFLDLEDTNQIKINPYLTQLFYENQCLIKVSVVFYVLNLVKKYFIFFFLLYKYIHYINY